MAYKNNIPQAPDLISVSQGELLQNFAGIKTLVDINHVTFDDADQGKHKWVTFPVQGAAPATVGTDIALYSKTVGADTALFLRKMGSGAEIDFTTHDHGGNGYTRLPSGIEIFWGSGGTTAAGFTQINFAAPGFTHACLSVTATYYNAVTHRYFVTVNTFAQGSFYCALQYYADATYKAGTITYIAIGY